MLEQEPGVIVRKCTHDDNDRVRNLDDWVKGFLGPKACHWFIDVCFSESPSMLPCKKSRALDANANSPWIQCPGWCKCQKTQTLRSPQAMSTGFMAAATKAARHTPMLSEALPLPRMLYIDSCPKSQMRIFCLLSAESINLNRVTPRHLEYLSLHVWY